MSHGRTDRWGWRLPLVVVLVVLATASGSAALVLGWTRATLIDTDGYVDALVRPLAADPEVKDAVSVEMARQLTQDRGADLTARFQDWIPASNTLARAALAQWGAQMEQGWRDRLQPAIRAQLDLPTFETMWVDANGQAHRQLIDALADSRTGASVTLDLHPVAQQAVRETGVQIDQQLGLPNAVATTVYSAMADSLPPEAGLIRVDVSRIGPAGRQVISLVNPLLAASLGATVLFALLAVGAAPPRRRGTAMTMLGLAAVAVATVLWLGAANQAEMAGDRAAKVAAEPFSPEMRLVVERQVALAADSLRAWEVATAVGGLGLVLVGGLWLLIAGRSGSPFDDSWDDEPSGWDRSPSSLAARPPSWQDQPASSWGSRPPPRPPSWQDGPSSWSTRRY